MNSLPKELQEIPPITSIDKCLEVAKTMTSTKLNAVERYTVHLAKEYFIENIDLFNFEELDNILSNVYFRKNIHGYLSKKILDQYIRQEKPTPWLFDVLFTLDNTLIKRYLNIVVEHNQDKQLVDFYAKEPKMVENLIYEDRSIPDFIVKEVLTKNPDKLLRIKSWTDEKKIQWLNQNKDKTEYIIRKNLYNFKSLDLSEKLKTHCYDILIEYLTQDIEQVTYENFNLIKNKNDAFIYYVAELPLDFLIKCNDQQKQFVKNAFRAIHKVTLDNSNIEPMLKTIEKNNFQWFLSKERKNIASDDYLPFIEEYQELLFQPIKKTLEFFKRDQEPFEYCFENKEYNFFSNVSCFIPFLCKNQQEMVCSYTFYHLKNHMNKTKELSDNVRDWVSNMILLTPEDILDKYWSKNKNLIKEPEHLKFIDMMMLKKQLDKKENHHNTKKIKI